MHTCAYTIWYIYRFVLYACCTLSSTAFNYVIMHAKAENGKSSRVQSTKHNKDEILFTVAGAMNN